jgi:hypothetical protein
MDGMYKKARFTGPSAQSAPRALAMRMKTSGTPDRRAAAR